MIIRSNNRFYPWLTENKYNSSKERYEFRYVYWNGISYDNVIIDVKDVF